MNIQRNQTKRAHPRRDGVAAVEMAMVLPILIVLLLGLIDVGQYANANQVVVNAAREGARVGSRNSTSNYSTVEAAVLDYLEDAFPGVSSSTLNSATTVTVRDSTGSSITGSMDGISTGSQFSVDVSMQFDDLRWIGGLAFMESKTIESTTSMRRE